MSEKYSQRQKQPAKWAQRQQIEQPSESGEEDVQIVEVKLRGQPSSKQTLRVFPEEPKQLQTYSQIHGKTQKIQHSKPYPNKITNTNDVNEHDAVSQRVLRDSSHISLKTENKPQPLSNYRSKDTNNETNPTQSARTGNLKSKILEITRPKTPSNREEGNTFSQTPKTQQKNKFDPERSESSQNSQIQPSVQSSLNQPMMWPQSQQAMYVNPLAQSQQVEVGYLQQSTNWMQGPGTHASMYNQPMQTPPGYFPTVEIPNQQMFHSQYNPQYTNPQYNAQYNPFPYPQAYQQYHPQAFHPQMPTSQFVMPQVVVHPYQIATNPGYHPGYPQPYSAQPYAVYAEEGNNRWFSQDHLHPPSSLQGQVPHNIPNGFATATPNNNAKKVQERVEENGDTSNKWEIKNYLEDQENFLRKLEEEKKQPKREIAEKGRPQPESERAKKGGNTTPQPCELSQHSKSDKFEGRQGKEEPQRETPSHKKMTTERSITPRQEKKVELQTQPLFTGENLEKIQIKQPEKDRKTKNIVQKSAPKNEIVLTEEIIMDEFNEESAGINLPPQRQKNAALNDKQTIGVSKTPSAKSQKPLPKSEAFEIVWDDKNQQGGESLADMFKKRKKGLAERLDREKMYASKKEKGPEKTKEELFQIRKQMMEYKGTKSTKETGGTEPSNRTFSDMKASQDVNDQNFPNHIGTFKFEVSDYKRKKSREPNPALIERLAGGVRTKVSVNSFIFNDNVFSVLGY